MMEIRTLSAADAQGVVEILNQGIDERANAYVQPFSGSEAERWFRQTSAQAIEFVGAFENEVLLGWGMLWPYRGGRPAFHRVAEITYYVHAKRRRKGVASSLIFKLETLARQSSIEVLIAILLDDNDASIKLLQHSGYLEWGRLEELATFDDAKRGHLFMYKRIA